MRSPWPLAAILVVASVLVFTNLGRDHLWSDEGDTAVLAASILDHGVPTAWDGVTFSDADYGKRLTDDFVMVSHPWLQYYLVAGSFALLGETAFAARLPFALLGLVTIALVYMLVQRASGNRLAASSSAILLTLSVQFLLYARQSRNYTLNAALTCLLVWQFTRLTSWRQSALFALVGILLFHSHPIGLVPLVVLGVLTLVYAPLREYRRWCWLAMPVIAVFTLPWLVLGRAGYSETTAVFRDLGTFFARFAQFGVEMASVTSIVGAIGLGLWLKRRQPLTPRTGHRSARGLRRAPLLIPSERALVVILTAIMGAYAVAMSLTQSRDSLWMFGMRYTPAVIAFSAILGGMLAAKASRGNWKPWVALMLVAGFTKLGRVTPWTFWAEPTPMRDASVAVTFHTPPHAVDRILRTGQIRYLQSLVDADPGTTGRIVEFLTRHAGPEDIVITNYGWEPLYFHTQLRQGMKVLPSYPVYSAAREAGLPAYVFGADGVRWIVWRQAWGNYRGHDLGGLLDALDQARVPVTRVATIPETMWENRENIHFRRYPDNRYVFAWYDDVPDTMIFRVDWPKPTAGDKPAISREAAPRPFARAAAHSLRRSRP